MERASEQISSIGNYRLERERARLEEEKRIVYELNSRLRDMAKDQERTIEEVRIGVICSRDCDKQHVHVTGRMIDTG